ncbi:hypothetical protein A3H85_00315 [Candidatus Daviesbacteria bacterium RIFCSPLOWO2_02_FULL_40_8]|uniref:AAA+ ATPase domain-containing protein n=1 Tax=Candidatus Daviesbacteria bacterium RIFCSPLOWO2_01_FULL_40_24 TaxID=1797787 RepID=A0A1F5MJY9_9BACT|nr:MAG: hypothetical protein A2780_00670 [Candidatus Daviesbacteria bacterium RIFCSPHIGHO2_01_FULL_41_45]OGE34390.1 MAG: hypothetical protein A3C32_02035 [Candidatus Daviesbacteria bacterium RIFCSPHIGHO2_02_FULL_41_14]OGE65663.1 MAG: hypothetical protein A3B49_01670 [Candidatus Daviesbacteria bacterium RIFCSPLOWO2_01_FULL_40_24]OGE66071.1 MAG: hypothetical protein A3H85_00315 [Candidatus Daviesbacteria bacterium RIFCSPLOWO2_02_FULL_40_8]
MPQVTGESSDSRLIILRNSLQNNSLPEDLKKELLERVDRLVRLQQNDNFQLEFDREIEYVKFVSALPFNTSSQDVLDIKRAQQILDQRHYGLKVVKDRILEYLSVLILNSRQNNKSRSQVLAFVGLAGSGKTSLAYTIAESLGRKLIRIPFGGLGSVRELRGETRLKPDAEAGIIMRSVMKLGVNNPVILLDEIDRVSVESRADIMGVLVELLDPEQNFGYVDHYINYPFDLSKALFLATANNTASIATAVLDRLELIEMPSYSDEEKIVIGSKYLLPRALKEAGLPEGTVVIDEALWPTIVRPLGFDGGIRSLGRSLQSIVRKVARQVVEGHGGPYHLTAANINQYI